MLGPILALFLVFAALGAIPFSDRWQISGLDSGVFFVFIAIVCARLMLFWTTYSVRSQWSPVAAIRMLAMMSQYLLPLLLAIIPPIVIAGGMDFTQILSSQGGWPWNWNIFHDPGAFLGGITIFGALHLWQNRAPFDYAYADTEIGGGLPAESSGVVKGLVSLVDVMSFYLACSLVTALYFGGGKTPFSLEYFGRGASLVQFFFFALKTVALALFSIWLRWSIPRLRIDQITAYSWNILVPFGLASITLCMIWSALTHAKSIVELFL